MTSQTKIISNRANARKSTGPKSGRGKSQSRLNALKSGVFSAMDLLPGEDRDAFDSLSVALHDRYQPSGPIEILFVRGISRIMWRLDRLEKAEHATLKRIETDFMLASHMGTLSATYDAVDLALIDVLERDERCKAAKAPEDEKSAEVAENQVLEFEEGGLPPIGYTFQRAYAPRSTHCPLERIDQQRRALMRELYNAIEMLKAQQEDRRTISIAASVVERSGSEKTTHSGPSQQGPNLPCEGDPSEE